MIADRRNNQNTAPKVNLNEQNKVLKTPVAKSNYHLFRHFDFKYFYYT